MNKTVKCHIGTPMDVTVCYGSPGERGVINSGDDTVGQEPSQK